MDNGNEQKTLTSHCSETVSAVLKCAKDIKSLVPYTLAYEQFVVLERLLNIEA